MRSSACRRTASRNTRHDSTTSRRRPPDILSRRWRRSRSEQPDDVEGAYRLVIAPGYGEEGCELLVFGRGKRGAFHLRGAHTGIPLRDARDVPLKKGQWRAIVDYVEAKRFWDTLDDGADRAVVMDGVCHSFAAIGPELHAFELTFGSVPDARIAAVRKFVLDACATAARAD